tara:strand:+ start:488 stop:760 length:273 start_codon:yes stop_codon:yes gene_type:complete
MFRQVENKGRYKTAQPFYWHIKDQNDVDYLFTDSALKEAEKRAEKNPEDIPMPLPVVSHDNYLIGFATGLVVGFAVTAATYFVLKYFIGI